MPKKMGREKAMRLAQMAINETGGMGSMARKKRAMELAETGGPGGLNVGMEALRAAPRLTQAAANAPIGVDTPMGPMGTPGYLDDRAEARRRSLDRSGSAMDMMNVEKPNFVIRVPAVDSLMQERNVIPMEAPPIEELTQDQSAKLAEIRGNPAFDLGFREGIEDYQNLKIQSEDILDELAGSMDGAKSARTNVFLGNMTTADIRRLGYAEAMEFAEREENNREQKILRQGMMER